MVELAPNVQQVITGANNLIVNMKDDLAIFDASVGEGQSNWVIDAAKAKYPGKPIKYLILTHHHMDHTGGMRTYAAEGATIRRLPASQRGRHKRSHDPSVIGMASETKNGLSHRPSAPQERPQKLNNQKYSD